MSSADDFAIVSEDLKQSFKAGRLSHAYLVAGHPRGEGGRLAVYLLQLFFCESGDPPCGQCRTCRQVAEKRHPDIRWLEPESKARRITVDDIREVVTALSKTSYADSGWKAAVIQHADCLQEQAQNAFLKTLEEPPGKSVLILVTDQPQALLPTIVSRCQRVAVAGGDTKDDALWKGPLMEVLRGGGASDAIQAQARALALKNLLTLVKEKLEEDETGESEDSAASDQEDISEDVANARVSAKLRDVQEAMFRIMLLWSRDVLCCVLGTDDSVLHFPGESAAIRQQAAQLTYGQALDRVNYVEEMIRRAQRNIPVDLAFEITQLRAIKPTKASAPA